ncbi:MAG: Hsp20/alpha crystallin family protein [Candidatus Zixiibacteriota bacterium]
MRLLAYLPELRELLDLDSDVWNPKVDLFENAEEWVVLAEVPGVSKKDLRINFENGVLTLKGERKDDSDQDFKLRKTKSGSFCRGFTFPLDIDPELIKAELKDGVLKVRVPKPEESRPKEIKVN